MDNKHQTKKLFRFESFHERIKKVDPTIGIKLGKYHNDTQDEDTPHFAEALMYWADLNCTQHFVDFYRGVANLVQSHSQLLLYKEKVAESLLQHLKVPNNLALQALLDLTVHFARDLQDDFLIYFESLFGALTCLLNVMHHDVDALEWIFTCLAMLLKFLWRYLVKDLPKVYSLFSPLFSTVRYQEHVVTFAAESFSYLMRKAKNKAEFFDFVLDGLSVNNDHVDGVGRLLFEMIKKSHKQFFFCANDVIALLLDKLCNCPEKEGGFVLSALTKMWTLMCEYLTGQSSAARGVAGSISEQSLLVLNSTLNSLDKLHTAWQSGVLESCHPLVYTLKLLHVWIGHRSGLLIMEQSLLVQLFVRLLQGRQLSSDGRYWLLKTIATFLQSTAIEVEVRHRSVLISEVYKSGYFQSEIFEFTADMYKIPLFEKDALPALIGFCHNAMASSRLQPVDILSMFVSLILVKMPPSDGYLTMGSLLRSYTLDFRPEIRKQPSQTNFPFWLGHRLKELQSSDVSDPASLLELWAIVYCIPNVMPLRSEEIVPIISSLLSQIYTLTPVNDSHRDLLLSVAEEAMVALCRLTGAETLKQHVSTDVICNWTRQFPSSIPCLRVADLFTTVANETKTEKDDGLSQELFDVFYQNLQCNLSSPFSLVRLLSLHILSQFKLPLPLLPSDVEVEQRGVIRICLDAELSPLTALNDRIRLNHLRRLDHEYIHHQLNVGLQYQMPLRFLIGQLYVNFASLWGPVKTLIKSYAMGMNIDKFWEVYSAILAEAAENIYSVSMSADCYDASLSSKTVGSVFLQYQQLRAGTPDRPDYVNFRHQLWEAMHEFPSVCEPRSKIIVPQFLAFLNREYLPGAALLAATQDIRVQTEADESAIDDEDVDDVDMEVDEQNEKKAVSKSHKRKVSNVVFPETNTMACKRKKLNDMDVSGNDSSASQNESRSAPTRRPRMASDKTLLVHLGLFAKFHDPKSLVQQTQLYELYLELLKSRSPAVQKTALDCLMTYKFKYLMPYRENFQRLIDEKSFRNEIVLFSIDSINSVVLVEHRADMIPILMRILYGKMRANAGRDSSSKMHMQARKITIMSFIAQSQPLEIKIFFDLVFKPFQHYMSGEVEDQVKRLFLDVDLSSVIPPRKLQSVLDTVNLIIHKFGVLASCYLPSLLQIVVCVAATSSAILDRRDEIQKSYVNTLKSLQQKATTTMSDFFTAFESYPYSAGEIEAIFISAVWPRLDKLSMEGVYSPTALLKLFHTWSKNPRYMVLLSKYRKEYPDVTPLRCLFTLLGPQSRQSVISVVMDVVDNLLLSDELDTPHEASRIEPKCVANPAPNSSCPYGITLILPHVPVVLEYLHQVVKKLGSASDLPGRSRAKMVPELELRILSSLSEYVTDQVQSTSIVGLLLPFLGRRLKRTEEIEVNILTSIKNLICNCLQPQQFIGQLLELFSILSLKQTRLSLCDAVQVCELIASPETSSCVFHLPLAKIHDVVSLCITKFLYLAPFVIHAVARSQPSLQIVARLATNLNAWDRRQLDEPDLTARMDAFSEAGKLLTSDEPVDVEFLLMLVHNCTFLLATLDGLGGFALRDQSSECLTKLISRIARDINNDFSSELFRVVIIKHLLSEVKSHLKLKSESCRHSFISLLETLICHFPSSSHFADLVPLRDERDIEVDFFKNVVHVQLHRRMKSLRRLSNFLEQRSVKPESIVNYILPIVTSMLRDPTFIKNSDRVDVAVEALKVIVQRLPWPRYLIVLRYYLNETLKGIENQKLSVKILSAVLDSFHFDLKNSEFTEFSPFTGAGSKTESGDVVPDESEEAVGLNDETVEAEDENMDCEANSDSVVGTGHDTCSVGLATRIHRVIEMNILPQLHKCLTKEGKTDGSHKLAVPGKYAEDEEILRVPVALAMVKLLQHLPRNALDKNLPSVLLKVCHFLSSRSKDIRTSARDTLTKIVLTLGAAYFSYVLNEMCTALKRGYQLHVLCYSVWAILKKIQPTLKPGDLDASISKMTEVFNSELFGQVSDEKEVEGIVSKLFEAKTTKSVDSYGILATLVSRKTLLKLIVPLKTELMQTHSSRITKKIADVLKLIGRGLMDNKSLELDFMLTFVYGLASDSIVDLSDKRSDNKEKSKKEEPLRPSTLLLKPEPKRVGSKPKLKTGTNSHVLVEFGLQLLHMLLKRSVVTASSKAHLELLDPFVAIMSSCLSSKYVKVTATSLRCLTWMLRMPLPSFSDHIKSITSRLFLILNNYAGAGAGKGDNFELVVMCFKAVTVLVRDVVSHTISDKQLHVLLVYAKQDLNDFTRQATAFSVLKAIISRKLIAPEMEDIMREVEQMSITAEAHNIRQQCRQIAWQFMLDYPLGRKLVKHIEFYLQQLQFEHESGRVSALEMLSTIFNTFPQGVINEYAGLFFTSIAARIVNDDSADCRQMAAAAVKLLLCKLDSGKRDSLIDMCIQWMKSAKTSLLVLSAKVTGLFAEVEGASFRRHIETVLEIVEQHVAPENYKQDCLLDQDQHELDMKLFDFLSMLLTVVRHCSSDEVNICWSGNKWSNILDKLWESVEAHLVYPHDWVRLVSSQLINQLFSACSTEQIVAAVMNSGSNGIDIKAKRKKSYCSNVSRTSVYLTKNLRFKLRSLSISFCKQLSSPSITQQHASEIVHGLLHITRLIVHLPESPADEQDNKENISLLWLLKRVVRETKKETSGTTRTTVKRFNVFTWLLGVATILGPDRLLEHLPRILSPLVREMTDSSPNSDSSLKTICQETLESLKQIAGPDEFSRQYAIVQQSLTAKRQQRKVQRSIEAVTNPMLGAHRKLKKNLKKKEAKKRKIANMRPSKKSKKARLSNEHLAEVESF